MLTLARNDPRVSYILLDKIDCKNLLVKCLFWKYCSYRIVRFFLFLEVYYAC